MRIRILGRYWELKFVVRMHPKHDAECDSPDSPGKQIRIRASMRGRRRLELLIHEFLHAMGWILDEDIVERAARDLSYILWMLGYRAPEDKES